MSVSRTVTKRPAVGTGCGCLLRCTASVPPAAGAGAAEEFWGRGDSREQQQGTEDARKRPWQDAGAEQCNPVLVQEKL